MDKTIVRTFGHLTSVSNYCNSCALSCVFNSHIIGMLKARTCCFHRWMVQ